MLSSRCRRSSSLYQEHRAQSSCLVQCLIVTLVDVRPSNRSFKSTRTLDIVFLVIAWWDQPEHRTLVRLAMLVLPTCLRCYRRCTTECTTCNESKFTKPSERNRVRRMRPSAKPSAFFDDPSEFILSRSILSVCACMPVCLQVNEWEWVFTNWRHLWEKTG